MLNRKRNNFLWWLSERAGLRHRDSDCGMRLVAFFFGGRGGVHSRLTPFHLKPETDLFSETYWEIILRIWAMSELVVRSRTTHRHQALKIEGKFRGLVLVYPLFFSIATAFGVPQRFVFFANVPSMLGLINSTCEGSEKKSVSSECNT